MTRHVCRRPLRFAAGPTLFAPAIVVAAMGCRDVSAPPTTSDMEPAVAVAAADAPVFRQLTVGEDHTCGVTTANAAYCWGSNGSGELGIGPDQGPELCFEVAPCSTTPVAVIGGLAFREVNGGGRFHTCGVTTANVAFCWGTNSFGQLGNGTEFAFQSPHQVAGGLAFRQVSAGILHTCGVTTSNVAYCWGHNQAGELGDGTTNGSLVPVRVARNFAFRQVSAGEQLTCGVTTDDLAYCWGANSNGQLGIGNDEGPESCFTGDNTETCSTRPVRVRRGLAFRQVSAALGHACGVTTENVAFCWGSNGFGQLGNRTNTGPELCVNGNPCSTRPVRVAGGLAFNGVAVGVFHTCGVATSGTAYCWGANGSGELGVGSRTGPEKCFGAPCSTRPVAVVGDRVFRSVRAGATYSCGVTMGNVALCWGLNSFGQLGDGTTERRLRPRRVVGSS